GNVEPARPAARHARQADEAAIAWPAAESRDRPQLPDLAVAAADGRADDRPGSALQARGPGVGAIDPAGSRRHRAALHARPAGGGGPMRPSRGHRPGPGTRRRHSRGADPHACREDRREPGGRLHAADREAARGRRRGERGMTGNMLRWELNAFVGFIERQKNLYRRYWAWEAVWLLYNLVSVLSIGYLAAGLSTLGLEQGQANLHQTQLYLLAGALLW